MPVERTQSLSPWLIVLTLSFLFPYESAVVIGGLRLFPYRIVLMAWLVMLPFLSAPRDGWRLTTLDVLVWGHIAWVCLAFLVVEGFERAFEAGGIYIVEAGGAYTLARRMLGSEHSVRRWLKLMIGVLIILFLVALPETLLHSHFLRQSVGQLTGSGFSTIPQVRLGLMRAGGPFPHPIHYGVFCAAFIGLLCYSAPSNRPIKRGLLGLLAAIAAAPSISSGPFTSAIVQFFIIIWDRVTGWVRNPWLILCVLLGVAYCVLLLASNRPPMHVILSYLTLDPGTAYQRLYIFDAGIENVRKHPIFGLGFRDWERFEWMNQASVDNFWLLVAMRHGIPAFVMLVAAVIVAVTLAARCQWQASEPIARYAKGAAVSLVGMAVAAATVHLWEQVFILLFLLLGMIAALGTHVRNSPATKMSGYTRREVDRA